MAGIKIAVDRGGTFSDVIAHVDGKKPIIFKLLSEDPANYVDAPSEAIRRVLEVVEGRHIPPNEPLDGSRIVSCRIGTTIATNALLERKGEKFAFLVTKGFKDVCVIGDQSRPKIFDLKISKAEALHDKVVEVNERVVPGDYDLNPDPWDLSIGDDPQLVRSSNGEIMRILRKVDENEVIEMLRGLWEEGYRSIGIAFMHAYLFPDHEQLVARLAADIGFNYITTSSETSPNIKYLNRSNSVCSEAYLYPVVKQYVKSFEQRFRILPQRVDFMCSDGGLKQSQKFSGNAALLSGPAGGVVCIAKSCYDSTSTPTIGFDMGGTSTDVSRYDGEYDFLTETTIAGRTINVPMLNIATVAAGGGSILFARNGLLAVGPESAGAHPGPACYRKGGPLTVTDANLFLGRLLPSSFPCIFGDNADQPLDTEVVAQRFAEITAEVNRQTPGQNLTPEEVALGFIDIANETMSRPIRNSTEARGYSPESHNLVSFGGAGGQHACAIADKLGIKKAIIHKWSSLLSAYGIAQASLQTEKFEPYGRKLTSGALEYANTRLEALRTLVGEELLAQGAEEDSLSFSDTLMMRYFGTDTNLAVPAPADGNYAKAFETMHLREFAFSMSRDIIIESIKVRGVGSAESLPFLPDESPQDLPVDSPGPRTTSDTQRQYVGGNWQDIPVYKVTHVGTGSAIEGPALVVDNTQTILVEPSFRATICPSHVLLVKCKNSLGKKGNEESPSSSDPTQLSVFAHRFMAIAEQMGNTLQRTSISTSIKERLDFSCAVFSPSGTLVANAPHIPIHLGSMQFAIQAQHRLWQGKLQAGDVLLTNHPQWGGTHLPDITVVSPVMIDGQIAFYVASRGHHTDIGGKGITSMMPESKELWEEGLNVTSMKIVSGGTFLEDEVREAFNKAGSHPGCSPTRRLADNISDLKAQTSANQRGIVLLQNLCSEYTLPVVHKYMEGIQDNAEMSVRDFFRQVVKEHPTPLQATDYFDDGTSITVEITIDPDTGGAVYDFSGSGPQVWGNYNCPISITHSAIIYTTRCLVDIDIPLNDGCLKPIQIKVPEGSILNPTPAVAICGSTLASQRVVDLILRAYGRFGASQGCGNSLGWGMGGKNPATGQVSPGWNYGESIGGGVGAGDGYHGAHSTHVHSTNTRQTDPEVVEKRTAVIVNKYETRKGSGGKGEWRGGDGITREIKARIPLRFSILSDRRVYRPYPMAGGEPGRKGQNNAFIYNSEGALECVNLGGKSALTLKAGEYIQINTPGGGGYGRASGKVLLKDDYHAAFA